MFINPESKQHPTKKDFYSIPGHEEYSISRDGKVIITETGEEIKITKDRQGYPTIAWGLSVHRCLALTFIPLLEGYTYKDLYVNHIDGIKDHSYISNLEWVTPSGNSLHAYKTGLRDDNVPLLCKDYLTNKITEHYSLQDCARYIERNACAVHDYLKSPNKHKRLLSNRYSIIKPGEDWPIVTNLTSFNQSGFQVDWVLCDLKEKKTYITSSLTAAAEIMGIKPKTVNMAVSRALVKNIYVYAFENNRYLLSRKRDVDTHLKEAIRLNGIDSNLENVDDLREQQHNERANNRHKVVRPPVPIRVTNLYTNEVKEYPSSEYFCNNVLGGVKKNTFQCALQRNGGIYKGTYRVEYLNKKS